MTHLALEQKKVFCGKCGNEKDLWIDCYQCGGEGGYHDCGEDCCCCLDEDEITNDCAECQGQGGWLGCPMCNAEQ